MKKYYPAGSLEDPQNVVGYVQAQAMVQVLKQCGDDLTRENVMQQAANLKEFHPAMLLKGINMNTSPTDYQPMEEMLLQRFNGERFEVFGELLSARRAEVEPRRRERQMAKRKSINYPGFKHENPIPNASRIGNILMSSIISGRDPDTSTMPPELPSQVANIFKQIRLVRRSRRRHASTTSSRSISG